MKEYVDRLTDDICINYVSFGVIRFSEILKNPSWEGGVWEKTWLLMLQFIEKETRYKCQLSDEVIKFFNSELICFEC